MQWSRLRFARALQNGDSDLEDAVTDVRHLGRLCQSAPYLIGPAYTIALARAEASALEAAKQRGLRTDRWQTINPDRLDRWHAVLLASPGFLMPMVPAEIRHRALECMTWTRCAAITEAVGQAATAGLGESAVVDELIDRAERAGCTDITLLRRLRATLPMTETEARIRRMADEEASVAGLLARYSAGPDAGQ